MSGLSASHHFGVILSAMARDLAHRRRLPYLCQSCGTRADHTGRHWTPGNEFVCGGEVVWDSDQNQKEIDK